MNPQAQIRTGFFRVDSFNWVVAAAGLLLMFAPVVAHSEIIAAEDFEYDTATVNNADGGTGWADTWSGWNMIGRGSLTFSNYAAKGRYLSTLGDTKGGGDALKSSFRTPLVEGREHLAVEGKFGKPGTAIWIAFLASVPSGWDRPGGFGGVSLFDDRREQLFLGDCGATNVWGFERCGQLQRFSAMRADTNVTFLVYRIEFRQRNALVEMWLNPGPGADEPPEAEIVTACIVREFRFTRVRISSAPAPLNIDALRIGTTYADVAPAAK